LLKPSLKISLISILETNIKSHLSTRCKLTILLLKLRMTKQWKPSIITNNNHIAKSQCKQREVKFIRTSNSNKAKVKALKIFLNFTTVTKRIRMSLISHQKEVVWMGIKVFINLSKLIRICLCLSINFYRHHLVKATFRCISKCKILEITFCHQLAYHLLPKPLHLKHFKRIKLNRSEWKTQDIIIWLTWIVMWTVTIIAFHHWWKIRWETLLKETWVIMDLVEAIVKMDSFKDQTLLVMIFMPQMEDKISKN
jgi:hypothetical protein